MKSVRGSDVWSKVALYSICPWDTAGKVPGGELVEDSAGTLVCYARESDHGRLCKESSSGTEMGGKGAQGCTSFPQLRPPDGWVSNALTSRGFRWLGFKCIDEQRLPTEGNVTTRALKAFPATATAVIRAAMMEGQRIIKHRDMDWISWPTLKRLG